MTDIITATRRALLDRFGLITDIDLAVTLDLSTETLRGWRKPGAGHPLPWLKIGNRFYYRQSDVQKWIGAGAPATSTPTYPER